MFVDGNRNGKRVSFEKRHIGDDLSCRIEGDRIAGVRRTHERGAVFDRAVGGDDEVLIFGGLRVRPRVVGYVDKYVAAVPVKRAAHVRRKSISEADGRCDADERHLFSYCIISGSFCKRYDFRYAFCAPFVPFARNIEEHVLIARFPSGRNSDELIHQIDRPFVFFSGKHFGKGDEVNLFVRAPKIAFCIEEKRSVAQPAYFAFRDVGTADDKGHVHPFDKAHKRLFGRVERIIGLSVRKRVTKNAFAPNDDVCIFSFRFQFVYFFFAEFFRCHDRRFVRRFVPRIAVLLH